MLQYKYAQLLIVRDLCANMILGHDVVESHHSMEFPLGGSREPLTIRNFHGCQFDLFSTFMPNVKHLR